MKQPSFVPLDKNKHLKTKIKPDPTLAYTKESHIIAISLRECPQAASAVPMVFIKTPQGEYHIAGLLGVDPGTNLYLQNDKWQGHYVPLNIQRYPFDIRGNQEQFAIYIDENSDLVNEEEGQALFDGDKPSQYLERVKEMMGMLADSEMQARNFIQQLLEHNLLDPMKITVTYANGEQKNLVGMFNISEKRVNELGDEAILKLMKNGALGIIYAMLTSVGQLNRLIQLSQTTDKPVRGLHVSVDEGEQGETKTAAADQDAAKQEPASTN